MPGHIKSIAVRPFVNETAQPGIGNKLWLTTTEEFIRDGRLSYAANEANADGVIIGTIRQYIETELSHDVNLIPLEYQLRIIMDLRFLDRVENQYLWQESNIEQRLRYFVETEPGGKTIEEAREELWQRFSQDIVRRTIEGFGSVTGSSPRSVPRDPRIQPPPQYPPTSPF